MKQCLKCKENFPAYAIVDGKQKQLTSRTYCLKCSPFGNRNTKRLHIPPRAKNSKKKCTECGREFGWTKNSVCSTCRNWKSRNNNRSKAIKYCGGKCNRCGIKDNDVLTFHHKNEKTKKFNLCRNWNRAWSILLSEIKKCELLCANCHMKHHRKEIL